MKKFVIYKRLSKDESAKRSNQHGFKSQSFDCQLFLDIQEDAYEVLGDFEEFISGAATIKPKLEEALKLCKDENATLLIAKVDRLSRRVSLTSALLEGDVDIKVACLPNADKFQINLYALLAEQERDFIRKRVKAALKVVKRDTPEKLAKGKNSLWAKSFQENKAKGLHKRKAVSLSAKAHKAPVVDAISRMLSYSKDSLKLSEISYNLEQEGFKTPRGLTYSPAAISRLIKQNGIEYTKKSLKLA